ncbi:MAG: hypothetical protein ACXWQ6_10810 [Candidatus Limnocylindrales bacterium]
MRRLETYLYSRRNIVASALALAGVALHLVGLVAGLEWLPITVGLYLIGALLVPAEQGLAIRLGAAQDASDVRGSLDRLLGQLRGKVADDLYAKVVSIQGSILATLAAEGESGDATDPNVYLIRQTALAYLPEAFSTYLRMPRVMAERRAIADGRTPHDVLLDQLSLMDSRLAEVADDIARHDSDKLLANGRFIAEKFAVSSLRVPADAATVALPQEVATPVAEPVAEPAQAAAERERVP